MHPEKKLHLSVVMIITTETPKKDGKCMAGAQGVTTIFLMKNKNKH
jgi:hypothetical protein